MAATCLYMNSILIEPKKPQNQFYPSLTQKPNVSFSIKLHEQSSSLMIKSPTIGLSETFSKLGRQGKVAFIPYITAGDPDLSTTAEALKLLNSCGSDIIELGLPYSNPWRDGPVNQAAAMRSLAKGADFNAIMSMLKRVIPQLYCPIVLLSYYNSILEIGTEKFMKTIKDVGVHGLLVPDIHLEETEILRKEALNNGIEFVLATSPNTPIEKMKTIVEASKGFIYLASSNGVTGARSTVNPQVPFLLQKIREVTTKPVAVGFGLSEPQHLTKVAGWGANGVIVGSAIVKLLGEAKSPMEGLEKLEIFIMSLKAALP